MGVPNYDGCPELRQLMGDPADYDAELRRLLGVPNYGPVSRITVPNYARRLVGSGHRLHSCKTELAIQIDTGGAAGVGRANRG